MNGTGKVSELSGTKPEAVLYLDGIMNAIKGLKDKEEEDQEMKELQKELLREQIAAARRSNRS